MFKRIGTKLYSAFGLVVMLTLLSSAVGVYYFEVSGDLNHDLSREGFPAYRDAWRAVEISAELDRLGDEAFLGARERGEWSSASRGDYVALVEELREALSRPSGLDGLTVPSDRVLELAWNASDAVVRMESSAGPLADLETRTGEIRAALARVSGSEEAVAVLRSVLGARDPASIDAGWEDYSALVEKGLVDADVRLIGEGTDGVFAVRQSWVPLAARLETGYGTFEENSAATRKAAGELLELVSGRFEGSLAGSLASFDRGRLFLFLISASSVGIATAAAWLWVGNMVVRRLSRLSARMRSMAGGDLDTPVPEVGRDEIGELAGALEVFRRQALEVQRLNLVEQLYGELREAHRELAAVQLRLVAQEKLAALGEIVSGVAHEISNPLNFVKNFAEGSGELSEELFEMLDGYREELAKDDLDLLDDIREELSSSLGRVQVNGMRALTIVQRMQSLGVVGGDPEMAMLHPVLAAATQLGCDTFATEWGDFKITPEFRLAKDVGEVALVSGDFSEAVVNLVSNACYALRARVESQTEQSYLPCLLVTTRLEESKVAIAVWDNGVGIDESIMSRIFNPFFTTRDGALGAGLGLPLALDVARRGGGDITVRSEAGVGTEFVMTVPLQLPDGADALVDRLLGEEVDAVRRFAGIE